MWSIRNMIRLKVIFLMSFYLIPKMQAQRKPDWPDPTRVPNTTEPGQFGYNRCGNRSSQTSNCQTLYVNSLTDFCLFAPPSGQQHIGHSEEYEVAWCTKPGRGTRQIPAGALLSAHFLSTPHYVQITGHIDGPALNIIKNDEGGELDPHGATGLGNPIGSLVYTTAFGKGVQQVKEWMNFMGDGEFCFRICRPGDPNAWLYCQHIYDVMGCFWVMPGNYDGGFDTCLADSVPPPGVYGSSTFHQGDPRTPAPHPAAKSSNCHTTSTISLLPVNPNTNSTLSISSPNNNTIPTAGNSTITAVNSTTTPAPANTNPNNSTTSAGMRVSTITKNGIFTVFLLSTISIILSTTFM